MVPGRRASADGHDDARVVDGPSREPGDVLLPARPPHADGRAVPRRAATRDARARPGDRAVAGPPAPAARAVRGNVRPLAAAPRGGKQRTDSGGWRVARVPAEASGDGLPPRRRT